MRGRALISTVYSPTGGVRTLARVVARLLEDEGWKVRLAHYMPWSVAPELSKRFPGIGGEVADWRRVPWKGDGRWNAYEIGARFPEFEWQRYRLNEGWRRAVEDQDVHLVVSGSILPAAPIVEAGRPCLAWVATRYWPDKRDRARLFPWYRRLFDFAVNTPASLLMERRLARSVDLLALSEHTAEAFARMAGVEPTVMPMGIDTEKFRSDGDAEDSDSDEIRLGFVGRLGDPRKNVGLLVETLRELNDRGTSVNLHLVGGELPSKVKVMAEADGVADQIRVTKHMDDGELPAYYRALDLFLIPSQQEGLGIVGLEAMACGCPVISTRCGGPEEYVKDGENGALVDFDAVEIASVVECLSERRALRKELSISAVQTVRANYNIDRMERVFLDRFESLFGPAG